MLVSSKLRGFGTLATNCSNLAPLYQEVSGLCASVPGQYVLWDRFSVLCVCIAYSLLEVTMHWC